jgi:diguanylate cyclase (GGDEF)-like protein
MGLQSALAVLAFGVCAWRILTLERSRQTLGTRALGLAFVAHALLWATYGVLFSVRVERLSWILTFNSYIDAVMQTMLAYGMVLVVMEETSREARTALHELEAAHVALRRAAFSDSLTGAWNRQAFAEGLGLDALGMSGGAVALLDVDNLKPVNDSFGHAAGDQLIRSMATMLTTVTGPQDAIYRWGGDEFLLVLPLRNAGSVREQLTPLLGGGQTVCFGGVTIPLRASVGCAFAADRADLGRAIAEADREMYRTKGAVKRSAPMLTDRQESAVG